MSVIKPKGLVELDGRTLEGGGQLLRIALCLSALTGIPVKIDNIRGNRSSGGGLKAQHLACAKWLGHACNATTEGAEKGSKTLIFKPGEVASGLSPAYTKKRLESGERIFDARLDIGTAGSTGLALQAILPFILFSDFPSDDNVRIRLTLSGGTNVSGSPSYEYITQVLFPTLRNIGFSSFKINLDRRGWSHGGSSIGSFTVEMTTRVEPGLPSFKYGISNVKTRRKPKQPSIIKATFIAPKSCHEHFRTVLLPALHYHFGDSYTTQNGTLVVDCEDSRHEKRLYFILVATIPTTTNSAAFTPTYTLGRDWLYDRKIRTHERSATEMAERVAKDLADEWLSGAYVDEHMRDQLVIFQALAHGRSEVYAGRDLEDESQAREPSLHARTAEWVAEEMLGVTFDAEGGCVGVGFGRGQSSSEEARRDKDLDRVIEKTHDLGLD